MIATGQCAWALTAVAVDPPRRRPASAWSPSAPMQIMTADGDALSSACAGVQRTISASIFTGSQVDSTAVTACKIAHSAVPKSCKYVCPSAGVETFGSIAATRRSGTSRSTASRTAHRAASIAARDPSMPTTTAAAGGAISRIDVLHTGIWPVYRPYSPGGSLSRDKGPRAICRWSYSPDLDHDRFFIDVVDETRVSCVGQHRTSNVHRSDADVAARRSLIAYGLPPAIARWYEQRCEYW